MLDRITAIESLRSQLKQKHQDKRPEIVCLCGSTRFKDAFIEATEQLTIVGKIVLSVGLFSHVDSKYKNVITEEVKAQLEELHKRKIDLADYILVLNVGGYIGESTRSEIEYTETIGKPVYYLETPCVYHND